MPAGAARLPAGLLCVFLLSCLLLPWRAALGEVRVEISGVEDTLETNIRASLDLVRHGTREDLSEAAVRRLYARANGQVREALRPFGYYRPRVEGELEKSNGQWLASLQVDPGEPVLIEEVDVRISGPGSDSAELDRIVEQSPVRAGRRLRHQEYDRLRNNLQSRATALGYFEMRFETRRLEVSPEERSARIELHLHTGPRYRFGKVNIEQDVISEPLLDRILRVREGEPYDADRVLETQYRLTDSLYFANVFVETAVPDEETRTVPIHIESEAARRQRIRLGAGYATDTRLRASIESDWRYVNKAGHSAGVELRLAQTLSRIGGRYRIPIGDPLKERLLFRGDYIREDLADLESDRITLGVGHLTLRGGDWQRRVYTDLIREQTRIPGEPDFEDTLLVPGISMEKLVADDILLPRRGYRVRGDLRGSHEALGTVANFLRFEATANRVDAWGEHWRFFSRGTIGIGMVDGFDTLPASQRFFAGGDQSVRGYGFNSLGPTDDEGNVIGGRHLLFASLEAERRIRGPVALAAFVDAGNAMENFKDGVEVSVGLGVNVHTPIGTLRVNLARSVTESRGLRFHLSIRPDL
ncbi:MAG TPA: autotransporter assembly complex family protein [Gammaproteobacteria bacterium]|nr:autotransporter assembly complex family protein [Gammaproteobacteria bacterium]